MVMEEEEEFKVQPPAKITIKDGRKPVEVYRTDLITAMKIPDHQLILPGSYLNLNDPWKQEWEKGVQVPVNMGSVPQPSFRLNQSNLRLSCDFKMPNKLMKGQTKKRQESKKHVSYDLDDEDVKWLKGLNRSRKNKGLEAVDELLMEKAIELLEDQCYTNMGETISTAKGLSIEYDENISCDVCREPDCEDGNEIVFCDVCDVAVHQACYGVQKVPVGSWVCKPCAQQLSNCPCLLCSTRGGAMKRTKTKGTQGWVHMSCALWIPEVGIGDVLKMEPITRIETIAVGRWNLLCYLCKEKKGACIQCSVKTCVTAFHVTCGFDNNLEMQTVLDESAPDGVRHVCYCYKHGSKKLVKSPRKTSSGIPSKSSRRVSHKSSCATPSKSSSNEKAKQEEQENLRQKKLRRMEEEFYKFADAKDLANELQVSVELARTFHRFWTLKRKSRDDASLLPPTAEQQECLAGRQIKPYQRATMEMERVVRLRHDLERVRNLCYMVEKREKQKRELIKARESVFLKELEIVGDTSGKMSSDDIRWAQSCCRKDFTEYETLQTLDLNYRRKPKTYKKLSKRRRRRIKQKNVLNSTEEEVLSSSDISDKSVETEGKTYCNRSDLGESSSMYSTTNVSQNLVDENTGQKSAISSETVSDKGHNEKDASGDTCCASSQRISKRLEDLSSDSDFEDESLRNTKLRSARRQRIEHLQSPEESKQKNEITRSEGVKCGSPGQSNSRLNGVRVAFSKDATTSLVPVKNFKTSGEIKQNVLRSSKRIIGRTYNGNRKRLFADLSRKIENSEKLSERVLRSSAGMLDGQMILDKFDIFLSPKRFCHRNGVVGSPKNDENADQNRNLRHAERLSDETPKVISEESVRTRSRCRRVDSGSPISSSTRRDSGFSENVSVHPNNSSYKPCNAPKESLADRCRTCRSPGKLSENSMKNSSTSFSNSRECSQFFGKFRRTAATSA